jgi:hypothetical protein
MTILSILITIIFIQNDQNINELQFEVTQNINLV